MTETITRTKTVVRPPTATGIYVDYGQYNDIVSLRGLQWNASEFGGSEVIGQLEYLGGAGCPTASYVEVGASLFSGGRLVENAFSNETDLPGGSPFPLTIRFESDVTSGRIELVVTDVSCP